MAWRSTSANLAAPALGAYFWHPEEATGALGAPGDTAVGGGGEKVMRTHTNLVLLYNTYCVHVVFILCSITVHVLSTRVQYSTVYSDVHEFRGAHTSSSAATKRRRCVGGEAALVGEAKTAPRPRPAFRIVVAPVATTGSSGRPAPCTQQEFVS